VQGISPRPSQTLENGKLLEAKPAELKKEFERQDNASKKLLCKNKKNKLKRGRWEQREEKRTENEFEKGNAPA
jgi:hypothetical protein